MKSEIFEFPFTQGRSSDSLYVKRFAKEDGLHLWTVLKHAREKSQIFSFYETVSPDKLFWHPLNDKRDELMKKIKKTLLEKLKELKKKKIQTYEFY